MNKIFAKIGKIFRTLFNSKEVTKKSYTNSQDLVKKRVEELKMKKDQKN